MVPFWLSMAIKVLGVVSVIVILETILTRAHRPTPRVLILGAGVLMVVLGLDLLMPPAAAG